MAAPKAPPGLGPRGRKFWRDIHATWELNRDEIELLVESCRMLDALDQLQAALDRDGVTCVGSGGQPRAHPALTQVTSTRNTLARLLAQLGLPDPAAESLPSPKTVRAQRAARARWRNHTPRGA